MNWYQLQNPDTADSPSLLIYKDRVEANIQKMIAIAGNVERLYVHVKTNKMPEVVKLMLPAGISKFKCATIAEAEMVCMTGGKHLVIAHQLVGPKIERLIALQQKYPDVFIASLVDNLETAQQINDAFAKSKLSANLLIDVNNGMNRSGHELNSSILDFYKTVYQLKNISLLGLHAYDGHLRDDDFEERKSKINDGFVSVEQLVTAIEKAGLPHPIIIAGGTPAFTSHALRESVFCSPGTCVLWDWGYGDGLSEQPFEYAAIVLTRVISKPTNGIVTIDMGHKAIAAENPIHKRIRFLNLSDYELIGQSEEHGVLKVANWENIKVGDVFYGVPYHVCPTVNLYDEAYCVEHNTITATWQITARKRRIEV